MISRFQRLQTSTKLLLYSLFFIVFQCFPEGMSLRCDAICTIAYCGRHESSHIIKAHTDSTRRLFVEICVNSWLKNLRKNIRVIRGICGFKATPQISTNFYKLFVG